MYLSLGGTAIFIRNYFFLPWCFVLGSCSLNLPPDTFKDLDLSPDSEPIHSDYEFSSRERAEEYLSARPSVDPVEGIWIFGGGEPPQDSLYEPQDPLYEVAIIGDEDSDVSEHDFLGIVIMSSNETFGSGDLKFSFSTAGVDDYLGTYYTGRAMDQPAIFVLVEPDLIVVPVFVGGEWQNVNIKRVHTTVGTDKVELQ
jgi:hypothetical protein